MTADTPAIGIIGPGRLGMSLAAALVAAGHRLTGVAGRDPGAVRSSATRLGPNVPALDSPAEVLAVADVILLTVQDSSIAALAASLPWEDRHLAVHCSGALGLDALEPAALAGASTGCLHPLQSFPVGGPWPERFRGITCGIEGDESATRLLEGIASSLGARTISLEGVDRALYHAAAVFANNDVVALMSAAARAWQLAGLEPEHARMALAPLLLGAATSVAAAELPDALTGPVARGDAATVVNHLRALTVDPELRELYRRLGAELLRVAAIGSPSGREALSTLLASEPDA